jgi:hypothetical protein
MRVKKASITGRWKITEMDSWDLDFIDTTEPGFIAFKKGGRGQLHFGCVDVELDWRLQAGEARVQFTFEGFDGAMRSAVGDGQRWTESSWWDSSPFIWGRNQDWRQRKPGKP